MRAFVALRISPETGTALGEFIDELRAIADGIGWVRISNLHMTLRFLGDAVDSRKLAPLGEALAAVAAKTAPFTIVTRGTGAFPDLARPRVIWVGLVSDELVPLAERVEATAVECGFQPERRPYSPHLTIGRVRSLRGWRAARQALEDAAAREFGVSHIETITLYRSILGPDGPTYEDLATFRLAS